MEYLVFQTKNLVFQIRPCISIEKPGISNQKFEILGFSHTEFEIMGISSEGDPKYIL